MMQTPMGNQGNQGNYGNYPAMGGQIRPSMGGQMGPAMMRPQMNRQQMPNKRKRPTDKILSKKLEDYVPEAKLYNQMVEFEKKLDSTITRKILDLQDTLAKPEVSLL